MILERTAEQEDLRQSVGRFVRSKAPSSEVRRLMETDEGYDPAVWSQMADQLGLQGIGVPEMYGGSGFGFAELAVVLEEMGRGLLPGPFLSSTLAATAIQAAGDEEACKELLPGLAAGTSLGTVALCEDDGSWDPSVTSVAGPESGGWRLRGHKSFVTDGNVADTIVTVARVDGGLRLFGVDGAAPGMTRMPLDTMDQTRKMARLVFDDTPARLLGDDEATPVVGHVLDIAGVLLAAEQVGVAASCQEMAVEYAKVRVQFGRPIGSFQAVKHRCADMLAAVELARSSAYHAVWAAAEAPEELPVAASMAQVACSDACSQVTADNVHVHGGIGFTWEHDAHLYFRRAKSSELLFGSPTHHRELLAQRTGL